MSNGQPVQETNAERKLRLEGDKLAKEIAALNHWRNGFTWLPPFFSALASLGIAAIALFGFTQGRKYVDHQTTMVQIQKERLQLDQQRLSSAVEAWSRVSLEILDEPSRLSHTHLATVFRPQLAVAVHDEMETIFILEGIGETQVRINAEITVQHRQTGSLPDNCSSHQSRAFACLGLRLSTA